MAVALLVFLVLGLSPRLRRQYHRFMTRRAVSRPPEPGLVPKDQQDTTRPGPDPVLDVALAAGRAGDWQPAAQLLADTGDDWDLRAYRAERLGKLAAWDNTSLKAWQAERPDDPTAALVEAHGLVDLAWKRRGGHYARYTSAQEFQGFFDLLTRARAAAFRAVQLAPEDPCARMPELWVGIGFGYSHHDFHLMWTEVDKRAPHHFLAHSSVLQYLCAKWCGSGELANRFAADAAAGAPLGSLLQALPLISWYEHGGLQGVKRAGYRAPYLLARVDALLADVAAARADHPQLPEARHLLAFFLYQQGRFQESAEQFRLVDGWIDALPWRYQVDPAEFFVATRNKAIRKALQRAK
ncbi:hypothetical protein C8250_026720 [Streptomyces sp. So13.3]|uniref:hypothetical protein n=1 Tax=Streptomyces TaxID=1883 RepID=UPI00110660A0|nr:MULTISPECIES: hypothetical protein [Streptomyces]MCZ4100417.1 hypothetical protein [Streptomyces sp. H39-C1]QNA75006.1 hypothetical protein C8250_026720 [Streptomyces sp. So13.3]